MARACMVVPAFNEEESIGATVQALGRLPGVDEVWVIDDGSRDATAAKARRAGARVVSLPRNRGKGVALTEGLLRVRADVIGLADGDLGASASGLAPLLEAALDGEGDLLIGQVERTSSSRGWGMAKGLACLALYACSGRRFASPLSGQRALRREAVSRVLPLAPGWGVEVGMIRDALRAGLRVVEVPVALTHRVTGRDWAGIRHRARQMTDIMAALAGRRLPEPPGPPLPGSVP